MSGIDFEYGMGPESALIVPCGHTGVPGTLAAWAFFLPLHVRTP